MGNAGLMPDDEIPGLRVHKPILVPRERCEELRKLMESGGIDAVIAALRKENA